MGENSAISWTHHTFNPWWGCAKVSAGCAHCYAEKQALRFEKDRGLWGVDARRRPTSEAYWRAPLKWDSNAAKAGERHRVFCASMADVFEDRTDLDHLRVRLFDLIRRTPHLDWLLLTKRPGAVQECLRRAAAMARTCAAPGAQDEPGQERPTAWWIDGWLYAMPPANVWLGVTVEDQRRADERIPRLLEIPARVRFLSCEPLLENVDLLTPTFNGADSFGALAGLHWIIVGGESGTRARPFDVRWARSIMEQCARADVACFVKQMGAAPVEGGAELLFADPKGGDPDGWPDELRVREIPVPQ